MFESIASKYLEAISERLPARYFLLFSLGALLWSSGVDNSEGVIQGILSIKVENIISLDFWKQLDVRLGALFLASCFVLFGVITATFLARTLFFLVDRLATYRGRVKAIYDESLVARLGVDERLRAADLVEKAEIGAQKTLKSYVGVAQVSLSFSGYLMLEGCRGLDLFVCIFVCVIGVLSVVRSVQYFISDYYPILIFRGNVLALPLGRFAGL